MLAGRDPQRIAEDRRPTVGSRTQPHNLRTQRHQPIIMVGGLVVECDLNRHAKTPRQTKNPGPPDPAPDLRGSSLTAMTAMQKAAEGLGGVLASPVTVLCGSAGAAGSNRTLASAPTRQGRGSKKCQPGTKGPAHTGDVDGPGVVVCSHPFQWQSTGYIALIVRERSA